MTPDDVRAAAEKLTQFHGRFAPIFGKEQAQDHAYDYVKGLMTCPDRKSIEPIALLVGHGDVSGLQKFINSAPWQYDEVQAEVQAAFDEELAPSAAGTSIGVVGVIDELAFAKKGTHSAGVARQHNGRMGKEDNCQVGVFLIGVTPAGSALLDHRLYLPGPWCEETPEALARREKAHIPEDVAFAPKARIAAELVRGVEVLDQTHLDWVVADEEYGKAGHFHDAMDELGQKYVLEVPTSTTVWTEDPAGCVPAYSGRGRRPTALIRAGVLSVAAIAASLPAGAWQALKVREGARGPLVFEFAAVRAWAMRDQKPGPPVWVLIRRSLGATPEIKYYISNGDAETPLKVLALVACTRFGVEEFFEGCKSYLGMAQYETRSYAGWHHHMALVALAQLFITLTRVRLKKSWRS
jgi:SRSO17 transposase